MQVGNFSNHLILGCCKVEKSMSHICFDSKENVACISVCNVSETVFSVKRMLEARVIFCIFISPLSPRSHILEDRSLKIERVRVSDEGTYICRAENNVGYVEALARLTVHCKSNINLIYAVKSPFYFAISLKLLKIFFKA